MKKIISIIIVALVFYGTINAQSVNTDTKDLIPKLNGHSFLSSTYLQSSFITTSLHANLGVGSTSMLKLPGIKIEDIEIASFEGKIMFFNVDVQYQQRFTPWLAMFLSFKMSGRLGTDISTIMADGVNTVSGGDIGWLIRIKHTEKLNLSGAVYVSNISGNFINLSKYFEQLINEDPYPSAMDKVPAMSVGVGLRGAYAFNASYGLQFEADYAYGESLDRSKTQGYFSGGILGDLNFMPKHNVPLGLALGYSLSTAPEVVMNNGGASNIFLGKLGYTGSNDFELGLEVSYYNVELKTVDQKPFITKAMLMLKFYF